MPTINDIAKEAGVSHGTVSNVLNKTGKVSIEKIQLVENAIKSLATFQMCRRSGCVRARPIPSPSFCRP